MILLDKTSVEVASPERGGGPPKAVVGLTVNGTNSPFASLSGSKKRKIALFMVNPSALRAPPLSGEALGLAVL